jgi:hypothetical protein
MYVSIFFDYTGCLNSKPDVLKCLCDLDSELHIGILIKLGVVAE